MICRYGTVQMKPRALAYCKAKLNYSTRFGRRSVSVTIRDARSADDLDFEGCGFTLREHRSEVTDWQDETHLREVHGAEIVTLARAHTGCDRVLVYAPIVRSPQSARRVADYAPIEFVHSDFTDDYRSMIQDEARPYGTFLAPLLERSGLSRGDLRGADRILMLQFWRNIGGERPDRPIAFCDARTVPRKQLTAIRVPEYGGQRLEFDTFGVRPPRRADDHHWYTFPGLTVDEVVMFRTYDSRCVEEDRPFWTPHSAFIDPNVGPDAPARASLEMRALCLFGA